jgi:hypothetical protein
MSTQRTKGKVSINQIGKSRMAPGNTEIVHAGEFRHGAGVLPSMSRASKYDHGHGPKEFTKMNKSVAKTGRSQNPKQVYIGKNGIGRGVEGAR